MISLPCSRGLLEVHRPEHRILAVLFPYGVYGFLQGCVTLEPCAMCAGAILQSRINRVVYGAPDPKGGAVRSLFQLLEDPRLNWRCQVVPGVLEEECAETLRQFFRERRARGSKT